MLGQIVGLGLQSKGIVAGTAVQERRRDFGDIFLGGQLIGRGQEQVRELVEVNAVVVRRWVAPGHPRSLERDLVVHAAATGGRTTHVIALAATAVVAAAATEVATATLAITATIQEGHFTPEGA